jgi:DNA-binding transcriptional ArsR family regulator
MWGARVGATIGATKEHSMKRQTFVRHPLSDELIELIAHRFRVLADPTRIKLLDRLHRGEASVQELTVAIGSTQQNVSKHLGVLLQAGIVGRRKVGNYAHYSIVDEGVFVLCEDVCGSLAQQLEALREVVGVAG